MNAVTQPALIETIRIDADRGVPLLERHMARLRASCLALGYAAPLDATRAAIVQAASDATAQPPRRLRLLVQPSGEWTLENIALPELAPRQEAVLWHDRLHSAQPLLRHKTTHRPWYQHAGNWLAAHPQVFDALFLNERGELCEGTRTNVYVLRGGRWLTPPLASGCLPGVQRAALLAARQVEETVLTETDLRKAQGVRLSNALRGWFDVVTRFQAS
jgi:4-amino-4-deoxychorismate lyase